MENVADKLCWEGGEFKAERRVQRRLESRGVFCLLYRLGSSCLDETLFRHSFLCSSRGGRWGVMIPGWMSKDAASYSDVKAKSGVLEPQVVLHVDFVPRSRR